MTGSNWHFLTEIDFKWPSQTTITLHKVTEIIISLVPIMSSFRKTWKILDFKFFRPKDTTSDEVFKTIADLDENEVKSHNLEGGIFNLPNPGCLG